MSNLVEPVGVDHVAVNVPDVPGAIAFYTQTMGLVQNHTRPDFGFPGAWLDAGDRQVHLVQGETPSNVGQHYALRLTDIDAAVAELRGAGVEVTDIIEVAPASGRQAFLSDPSGNGIELNEAIA